MRLARYSGLFFVTALTFLLAVMIMQLPLANAPMLVGKGILQQAVEQTGSANIVTSVVLAFRGLDTLGELAILFTAATAAGLLLHQGASRNPSAQDKNTYYPEPGLIVMHALDLLYPLLLVVGFYIIVHGHLTPGGGFQGGVVIASALFMKILARPALYVEAQHHYLVWTESLAGAAFISIGMAMLFSDGAFLQPFLNKGVLGQLWSAGTLPLLYLALGLKVGAELSGLLLHLFYNWEPDRMESAHGAD